jgi:anthranilate synthase/aminodeoxychorismate synthase-like glutamine amidotransferase
MLDNYDSFTYNIVQYFSTLGYPLTVFSPDQIDLDGICALKPTAIILSPGPGHPKEATLAIEIVQNISCPILGICLGMQVIGLAHGATIIRAPEPIHGKTSAIHHSQKSIFAQMPTPFAATRYHSLAIARESLPADLELLAWTETTAGDSDVIMGIQHRHKPIMGVQFHPESILSEQGYKLFDNFCILARLCAA